MARVEVFHSNTESSFLNNGFPTDWIKVSRVVRQERPLLLVLFILTAELLANKKRQDNNIKVSYGDEV